MSTPEEEVVRARLDEMFGDWDPMSGVELGGRTTDWEVIPVKRIGFTREREYEIVSGETNYTFKTESDLAMLSWEARVPDFLKPGRGIEGYDEFIGFLIGNYPTLFYDLTQEENFPQNYIENTTIILNEKLGARSKIHGIGSHREGVKFSIDFCAEGAEFKSLTINMRPDFESGIGEAHLFVTYPNEAGQRAELTIGLPLNADSIDGWTQRAMRWAIEYHAGQGRLDAETAAQNLSGTVLSLAERLYHQRFGISNS